MDYLRGYKIVREDPEWGKKILVGMLLLLSTSLIPVLGQVVLIGWQSLVLRRAVHGRDAPLPALTLEWECMKRLVDLGFKGFIVRFLWTMPVMLLVFAAGGCAFGAFLVLGASAARDGGDSMGIAVACCAIGGFFTMFPLIALLALPASVAAMRAELTGDMNQGLRFGEVMHFTKVMFRPLFLGTLVLSVVGSLLGILGILACYVGAFAVAVVGMIAQAHLMAQVYRAWLEQGGEPLAVGPDEV